MDSSGGKQPVITENGVAIRELVEGLAPIV